MRKLLTPSYRRHIKKHTRPHKCTAPDCNAGFRYKKDRDRHVEEKHGTTRWYCPYPECRYKLATEGTPRRANMERHIQRWHGDEAMLEPVLMPSI